MKIDLNKRALISDLVTSSAMHIDRDELDDWIACFDEESTYSVIPRENRELGYPAAIIYCRTKAILEDRIMVLRKSSKYNPHYDRHVLGSVRIKSFADDVAVTETTFSIFQSSKQGVSKLFCVGSYEDKILVGEESAKFKERIAILDTFSVPNLIATPI